MINSITRDKQAGKWLLTKLLLFSQVTSLTMVEKKKKAVNQETIKNPVKYLHKDWYLFLASTETNYVLSIFYIHLINLS